MPAWSGLQSVAKVDIAEVLAERFCRSLTVFAPRRVA
jgi:hypothetical protein